MKFVLLFSLAFYARLSLVHSVVTGTDGDITKLKYSTHQTFTWKFNGVKERTIRCSGVLVALNFLMTTAKCSRQKDLTKLKAYMTTVDFATGTAIVPTLVIVKEDYNVSTAERNVAMWKIPKQTAGPNLAPVVLPTPGLAYNGQIATLSGYGRIGASKPPSDRLQTATNTIIFNTDCNINPYQPPYPLAAKTVGRPWDLCTASPTTGGNSCFGGDEGAALVVADPAAAGTDPNILTGIYNFGAGSGNCLPEDNAVYVRITKLVPWIYNITDKNPVV